MPDQFTVQYDVARPTFVVIIFSALPGVNSARRRCSQLTVCTEDDVAELLQVPDGFRVMALVSVGWPVGHFGPVHRRPIADIIHRHRW